MQKKKISNGTLAAIIVLAIIIADQVIKIWVKTSFRLGESMPFTNWAELYFIENPGMAFGIELGGKLFLSIFRILASVALVYFLFKIRKNEAYPKSFVVCLSMVTAGAIGGGYGTFLHGLVVDMFHFPLVQGTWPDWMPWVGGTDFEFFRPVFNLADAAISVGIVWLILFNSKYLSFSGIEKSEAGQHDGNQDAKQ